MVRPVLWFVAAGVATASVRLVLRQGLRWLVRRESPTRRWVRRLPRGASETALAALARRRQRADAVAALVARAVGFVAVVAASLASLHDLGVELLPVVGGAGFLGAALAIGAQHAINDYLTGLLVLLEDRFSEGDVIAVEVGGTEVVGVVERIGGYAVRVSDGEATWHLANRDLLAVRNMSQRTASTPLSVPGVDGVATRELVALAQEVAEHDPAIGPVVIKPSDGMEEDLSVRSRIPLSNERAAALSDAIGERLKRIDSPETPGPRDV